MKGVCYNCSIDSLQYQSERDNRVISAFKTPYTPFTPCAKIYEANFDHLLNHSLLIVKMLFYEGKIKVIIGMLQKNGRKWGELFGILEKTSYLCHHKITFEAI